MKFEMLMKNFLWFLHFSSIPFLFSQTIELFSFVKNLVNEGGN